MNERQKTAFFIAVAIAAVVLGAEPWRGTANVGTSEKVVKLFPKFEKAADATNLQVIEYDENAGSLRPFSIKQVDGKWVIPSHENYPADARKHMADAANSLLDLESLNMVSNNPGEHETYGVIDPDVKSLKLGTVGVGTRLTMKDANDKVLADLIIGKPVKEQAGLRYVRVASRDQVYVVKYDASKISTKFGDWIEKGLLQLKPDDLRQIQLNDYSIKEAMDEQGLTLNQILRSKITLDYSEEKSKWSLTDCITYKKKVPQLAPLKDDEELNVDKLNELKNSLNNLQIINVARKPKGLSRDLRASEDFVKNNETILSLAQHGFFPVRNDMGTFDILSSEGEVVCLIRDGVEYKLRFGNTADSSGEESAEEKAAGKSKAASRYLFVTCQLHEDLIPKPELQEVPGGDDDDAEKPAEDNTSGDDKADMPADAAPPNDDAAPPADAKPAGGKPGDKSAAAQPRSAFPPGGPKTGRAGGTQGAGCAGRSCDPRRAPGYCRAGGQDAPRNASRSGASRGQASRPSGAR